MLRFYRTLFLSFLFFLSLATCFIDPLAFGSGLAALTSVGYHTIKANTYCKFTECCIEDHIPADIEALEKDMDENLYGQHIVKAQIIPALLVHYGPNNLSAKPLVMSFHGTPGTGKNYVADMIAKNFYKKGVKSKFVHRFFGRLDFPLQSEVDNYKIDIKNKIYAVINQCPRALFIFDEVDKMPVGIFDSIVSLFDQTTNVKGHDFREAVFIFLSNAGGMEIAQRLLDLNLSGKFREETKIKDFEFLLELGAYNLEGGLKRTQLIDSNVIDHFIPFLPLEKAQVIKCIKKEFKRLNVTPTAEQVQKIEKDSVIYHESFATAGCKRLSKKVEIVAYPYFRKGQLSTEL